ncbi:MAG: thymidylate synthase, partial [Candidatus Marinimicrobia bacterium]|nr:thymidylate synthase [Candidatus Neomarinimicrobiota bacterium]
YSLLTMILAQECGYEPGEFAHTIIDAHIYENHIDGLKKQLKRVPGLLPTMTIAKKPIFELTFEDFELKNYVAAPKIKFGVAV